MLRTVRDIGALIRSERENAGWTQAQLAERVGASRLWISEVEPGKSGANLGSVLRTLAVLGVELHPHFAHEGSADDNDRRPNSAELIRRVLEDRWEISDR